ncbi:MAG: hypothetical protein WD042_10135, partial [Phycisphaeraceae bacterium]
QEIRGYPPGKVTFTTGCYANLGRMSRDAAVRKQAKVTLQQLATLPSDNQYTYTARIELARDLIDAGQRDDGLQILATLSEDAGVYYQIAQRDLVRYGPPHNKGTH